MDYILLNNGIKMPKLGFGTYTLDPDVTQKYVEVALEAGYRLIDTAHYYGNEAEVGQAISSSPVDRKDVFVTTKVDTSGYQATKDLLTRTLPRLGGYADLVIIHWPQRDNLGTWKAMEEFYRAGSIKSLGLSNFNANEVQEIIDNGNVRPVLDQIETHLHWQQQKMHQYLSSEKIVHESYSPLGEGMHQLLELPILKQLGAKYHKSPAQITLRYLVQSNIVAIPKSENITHIRDNFNIFDFELTPEECQQLKQLDQRKSLGSWTQNMNENQY